MINDSYSKSSIKKACGLTTALMKNILIKALENAIDKEEVITHEDMAQKVDAIYLDPLKTFPKLKESEHVDIAFPTIVQSGGQFDLSLNATITQENLSYDTIVCFMGAKFKVKFFLLLVYEIVSNPR